MASLRQAIHDPKVSPAEKDYQCKVAYFHLLTAIVIDRRVSDDELGLLKSVEELCDLTPDFCSEARVHLFRQIYLESVADRELTAEEEAAVDQIGLLLVSPKVPSPMRLHL
jgi:hypothetical protein